MKLLPVAAVLLSSLAGVPAAFAQMQTAPLLSAGGAGLALFDAADPLYDPYLLQFTPQEPLQREAIVDVRLDIAADGSVDAVEFLPGFHDNAMQRLLREPLEGLQFEPATAGGTAVAFPKLNLRIVLRGPNPPGVSEDLREALAELGALAEEKDFSAAERLAVNLLEDEATRLFELAVLEDQLAAIYSEAGRIHEALVASRLATGGSMVVLPPEGPAEGLQYPQTFLTPELHFDAQRRHFIVALLGNQTGEALQVWDALQTEAAQLGRAQQLADVARSIEQLQALLASEQPVGSAIRLVEGHWDFTMSSRRIFGVTALQGRVDYIDVACGDNPRRRLPFQNDTEFQIPASWGQCRLEFEGETGSQFNLYEYLN